MHLYRWVSVELLLSNVSCWAVSSGEIAGSLSICSALVVFADVSLILGYVGTYPSFGFNHRLRFLRVSNCSLEAKLHYGKKIGWLTPILPRGVGIQAQACHFIQPWWCHWSCLHAKLDILTDNILTLFKGANFSSLLLGVVSACF